MITVNHKGIDLRIMQQSNEVVAEGMQHMRGALSVNNDEGVATFVEDAKRVYAPKNPVFWKGENLCLRIDKEGKLRGTFRVDIPTTKEGAAAMLDHIDQDFTQAYEKMLDLCEAKIPQGKKTKKRVA